ncbi:MAG: hypothetical protein ACI898_001953 [Flavobacteriales bacterium]
MNSIKCQCELSAHCGLCGRRKSRISLEEMTHQE